MLRPVEPTMRGTLFGDTAGTRSAMLNMFESSHDWRSVKGPLGLRLPGGDTRQAFVLDNLLSPVEAQQLIYAAERESFRPRRDDHGAELPGCSMVVCDDHEVAKRLWTRVRPYVPRCWEGREAQGIHSILQFLRFDTNHVDSTHLDHGVQCGDGKQTRLSARVFLNSDCQGGATRFVDDSFQDHVDIAPFVGRALVFEHGIEYQCNKVSMGRKYEMRLEVVYGAPSLKAAALEHAGLGGCPGRHDRFMDPDVVLYLIAAIVLTFVLLWLGGLMGM